MLKKGDLVRLSRKVRDMCLSRGYAAFAECKPFGARVPLDAVGLVIRDDVLPERWSSDTNDVEIVFTVENSTVTAIVLQSSLEKVNNDDDELGL